MNIERLIYIRFPQFFLRLCLFSARNPNKNNQSSHIASSVTDLCDRVTAFYEVDPIARITYINTIFISILYDTGGPI